MTGLKKHKLEVLFSSKKQDWTTPQYVFDWLNKLFNFDLDAAADSENALCRRFFTEEDDALKQEWVAKTVYCNPPYTRFLQDKFILKGFEQWKKQNCETVVFLIPARVDKKVWYEVIGPCAKKIWFIKGRLRFGNSKDSAPFPSAIVIFSNQYFEGERVEWIDLL